MFDRDYHIGMKYRKKSMEYLDQVIALKVGSVEEKKAWRKYELCSAIADRHMKKYLHTILGVNHEEAAEGV